MSTLTRLPLTRTAAVGGGAAGLLRCGDLWVDPLSRRLRASDGTAVAIGSRAFDLLMALIEGHGQPLTGDQLRSRVWPGRTVADNNLRVQLTLLRRLLGRDAVEYLPGHGYRLTVPVEAPPADDEAGPEAAGNLPEALWPLLGRDDWLQRLDGTLQAGARLSLVAGGGIGKTSLALALATRTGARFADGAWWVDLAPLRDPQELSRHVAATLGLPVMRERALEQLGHALSGWSALLVLDNCEHVRAAASELADRLLRAAPRVALLVTSRVALGCAGEQVHTLPALALPGTGATWSMLRANGAVQLFEARACAADPRFRLRPENAQRVAEICRRLDGNAFAISLAAAQVPVLGLQWVHDGLGERLHWKKRLPGGVSDPPHHHSLAATLNWSFELLREPAQRLLRRLGVATGVVGAGLIQALAGCGEALVPRDTPQAVEALVAHGLLRLEPHSLLGTAAALGSEAAVYAMHESVRLYAGEQLAGSDDWAAAHEALAHWLLGELGGADGARTGSADPVRVWRLSNDVQVAVAWATQARPELAALLVRRCMSGWRRRGQHALAIRLTRTLLDSADAQRLGSELQLALLDGLCAVTWELERHDELLLQTQAMLALLDAEPALPRRQFLVRRATARGWQANVQCYRDSALAEPLYRAVLADCREAEDAVGVREALNNLGWMLQDLGRFDEARPLLQEALQRSLEAGDDWSVMVAHENLGELALTSGEPLQAIGHFAREAELAQRVTDLFRRGQALVLLVQSQLASGSEPPDLSSLLEVLQTAQQQGFTRMQCHAVAVLALCRARQGELAEAAALRVFGQQLRRRLGVPVCHASDRADAEVQALCDGVLGASALRAAVARGELMDLAELTRALAQRLDP